MEKRLYSQIDNSKVSIVDMAMGQIKEKIDYEMTKIIKNILDPETLATDKRVLNIKITIQPDSNRKTFSVIAAVSSKISPPKATITMLKVNKTDEGKLSAIEIINETPGQIDIDGNEVPAPMELNIVGEK